jgi:hypothetical protein
MSGKRENVLKRHEQVEEDDLSGGSISQEGLRVLRED